MRLRLHHLDELRGGAQCRIGSTTGSFGFLLVAIVRHADAKGPFVVSGPHRTLLDSSFLTLHRRRRRRRRRLLLVHSSRRRGLLFVQQRLIHRHTSNSAGSQRGSRAWVAGEGFPKTLAFNDQQQDWGMLARRPSDAALATGKPTVQETDGSFLFVSERRTTKDRRPGAHRMREPIAPIIMVVSVRWFVLVASAVIQLVRYNVDSDVLQCNLYGDVL